MKKYFFAFCLFCHTLHGLPEGKKTVSGLVDMSVKGQELHLIQKTDRAIVEWDNFSIQDKEITKFIQPSTGSAILNRVVGNDLSKIMGRLEANGKVYLLNENGILVGKTGVIDTRSFIASTLKIGNDAFLSKDDIEFKGDSDHSIINLGKILADQDIYLFAKRVANHGFLVAREGTVGLGSGQILLKEGKEQNIFVSPNKISIKADSLNSSSITSPTAIENTGTITSSQVELIAVGGNLYGLAVNHEGVIDAISIKNVNGRVLLKALEGKTRVSGKILNTGTTKVLGEKVHLDENAFIDASNTVKAGTVLIGGDYRGKNPLVQNAKITHVDPKAQIFANGLESGSGGKVILWGDWITGFYGYIEAKGGQISGNGGFVEVSSPRSLRYKGFVTTDAISGMTGKLLLDPSNIVIGATASNPVYTSPTNPDWPNYNPTSATANLNVVDLNAALSGNDVEVLTEAGIGGDGTVTVTAEIVWGTPNVFTITADQNIVIGPSGSISNTSLGVSTNPVIVLHANTDGSALNDFIGIDIQGNVSSYNQSISMQAEGGSNPSDQYGISIDGGTVTTRNGAISLIGQGGGDGSAGANYGIKIANAGFLGSTGASSPLAITITGIGGIGTDNNSGVYIADAGTLISSAQANVNITGTADAAGSGNSGMFLDTAALIESTGTVSPGTITIIGSALGGSTGNHGALINGTITTDAANLSITGTTSGTVDSNLGILLGGAVTTNSGNISFVGTGSSTSDSFNNGVEISSAAVTTKTGALSIMGTGGGDGSGYENIGVQLLGTSALGVTGPVGSMAIIGVGGSGLTGNYGFSMIDTSSIATVDANITIVGTAKGTLTDNIGVFINSSATSAIETTTGNIRITGTGSASGTLANVGVAIDASTITTASGPITITGTGRGSTTENFGIDQHGSISSTTGNITLTGTGSISGTSDNIGIFHDGSISSSAGAAISLTGTGGGNGTGNHNVGLMIDGGTVEVLGATGSIDLIGIGGGGLTGNYGVQLSGATATTDRSLITIIGTGKGSGLYNSGIIISDSAKITSSTTGAITLSGTATTTGSGAGVEVVDPALIATTTSGDIDITGRGSNTGSGTEGFFMSGAVVLGAAASTGNVTIHTDTINLDEGAGTSIISTAGDFFLFPNTSTTSIGLGSASTGTLNLDDTELGTISGTFASQTFGSPAGLSVVEMVGGFVYPTDIVVNGKDITVTAPVSATTNTATLNIGTVGAGTLNLNAIITSSATTFNGGASNDTFNINVRGQTGAVDGMGGLSNTLVGPTGPNIWNVAAGSTGTLIADSSLSYSNIQNLTGNTSDDTFNIADGGGVVGTINGGVGGVNLLDYSAYLTPITVNLGVPSATNIGKILNFNSFKGATGQSGLAGNTIIGPDVVNTWAFSGVDEGTITSGASVIDFEVFSNVTGGNKTDIFDLTAGNLTGLIDGGAGSNEVKGSTGSNTWNITDNNAGDVGSFNFVKIQNLTGNVGDDTFVFSDGKGVSGLIDGGSTGTNTLDYAAYTTKVTVDLTASTATATGGIVNLNTFIGGSASDTIKGPNEDNFWETTALNTGTITNSSVQTFTSFENLTGSSQDDTFDLLGGAVSGIVNGGYGGINTLDYSGFGVVTDVNLSAGTAPNTGGIVFINNLIASLIPGNTLTGPAADSTWTFTSLDEGIISNAFPVTFTNFVNMKGGSGNDTFDFRSGSITGTLNGGGGSNLLIAPNTPNIWLITSNNAGTVAGVPFTNITDFGGGTEIDDFVFSDGATIAGLDNGGLPTGINTLDYTAFTTPVKVIFLTETSGLASNLGKGFENIQSVVGNADITILPVRSLTANLFLSLRQVERFIYTDQFIPIRYINMYSRLDSVFTFYDAWEYPRHIQYREKEE